MKRGAASDQVTTGAAVVVAFCADDKAVDEDDAPASASDVLRCGMVPSGDIT